MISEKVQRIGASPTLKISAKAKAMKAEGIDVIDLSVGEPDLPTPENIKEAGIKAIRDNFTKYTDSDGILPLRKAIAKRLKEDFGLEYGPKQIMVSAGAKSSLFHLVQALVDEGEEVIIPAPYWVTYPECVALAKGKSVIVPTREEDGFLLTPEALKASISPATKAIILNNPANPTGGAYTKDQLLALAEVIRGEDVYVVADEIYSSLVYDNFKFTSFAALGDDIKKKTIIVNGVSKSYSMTGWRIGFAAGPAEVIDGMSKIQSHTTSNACSIAQKAGLEAYDGPQYDVQKMVAEFQRRRNYCLMRLATVQGLACFKPLGAFYLFPNVKSFYDKEAGGAKIRNSYGLAYYLLKEARVAIVPGDAFGADGYIRLSYATSMTSLEKSMDRIIEALGRLKTAKKAKRVALNNTATRVKKAVPVETEIDARMRDALAAEMEGHLGYEGRYEWNANINGAVIQLRTNVAHLNDFWVENFPPAPAEAGMTPHGMIYAVDGIAGREPRGFYHAETQTGILVNTDNYGSLRSLAIGLAMDIAVRTAGAGTAGAVRGMSTDIDGSGLILVGPPGTKKTELFFELLADPRFKLQANDVVFVRIAGGRAVADCVERKLYMPTAAVELDHRLAPLFDRSKCENVIVHKDDCQDMDCQRADDCRLDKGSLYCYKAAKEAHALLDPGWLGGPAASVRRTNLRWLVLLRNDATSPAVVEIGKDEALRTLEAGEAAGAKKALTAGKTQPYYNPHLLGAGPEKLEVQRAFFGRLLDSARCVLFNSGVAGADKLKELVSSGR
ncbi:MAG: aminotransferase class I and II [Candidatus Aminicenantes bacterium RBG_16_63_14]|nr:MAG: aminotransferase class I and II [Candidatus Aminicenantes bacterium RBG_16_63_14]